MTDVGRSGATKMAVLLVSGHTSCPQARSVGQQPPPSVTGQDRKPGEQVTVVVDATTVVEVGAVLMLVSNTVEVVRSRLELDGVGRGTITVVTDETTVVKVGAVIMIVSNTVEVVRSTLELDDVGSTGAISVVTVVVATGELSGLDKIVLVEGIGVTTTTVVEVAMHPSS